MKGSPIWLLIKTEIDMSPGRHNCEFHAGYLIAAVSIARLTSVEAFDDDGGKTYRGGKKISVVNIRQGVLLRSAALQIH